MKVDGDTLMAYWEPLCGYVHKRMYGVDRAVVDDLVADVLLRTLASAKELDERPGALSNWLFTVARNLLADYYRKHSRYQVVGLDAVDRERGQVNVGTDRHVGALDLYEALDKIRPEHQRLLRTVLDEDCSFTAAGAQLGLGKSLVHHRVVKARVALVSMLEAV